MSGRRSWTDAKRADHRDACFATASTAIRLCVLAYAPEGADEGVIDDLVGDVLDGLVEATEQAEAQS